jgi:hypothetical protein
MGGLWIIFAREFGENAAFRAVLEPFKGWAWWGF